MKGEDVLVLTFLAVSIVAAVMYFGRVPLPRFLRGAEGALDFVNIGTYAMPPPSQDELGTIEEYSSDYVDRGVDLFGDAIDYSNPTFMVTEGTDNNLIRSEARRRIRGAARASAPRLHTM